MLRLTQLGGFGIPQQGAATTLLLWMDDTQAGSASTPQPSANRGSISDSAGLTSIRSGSGKFGSYYMSEGCNGSNDDTFRIALPGSTDIRALVGTGAYTISGWFKQGASYSNPGLWAIFEGVDGGGAQQKCGIEINDDYVRAYINGSPSSSATAVFSSATTWKHIAICRSGGVTSAWYDGTRIVNQVADTFDFNNLARLSLGSSAGTSRGDVDFDDLALLAGALWSPAAATITVPTIALGS